MFYPSRLRKYLAVLFLVDGDDASTFVEHDKAGAGCALVNCSSIAGHEFLLGE